LAKRVFLVFVVILLFGIGMLPVLSMLVKSVMVDGRFSLASYGGVMTSPRQWTLMGNSMALASLVTIFTVAVGVPLGILLGKTDLPCRRFFTILFVIPLLIPPYIIAVSWFDLLGREGLPAHLSWVSTTTISGLLFGLPGCVAVLFSVFLPIPMLLTMILLGTVNPRLEEAGRLVSGWRQVMKGITIPMILPGILLSAMLVFLLSFGEFSVPNFLRYDVFPVESFTRFSAFYDFKAATATAVPVVAVMLILLLAEAAFLRDRTYQLAPSPEMGGLLLIRLGGHGKWLFPLVAMAGFIIVMAPILVLVIQSAGMDAYVEALKRAGDSLLRSFIYALMGATLLTFFGFFTGYLIQTKALRAWRSVDSLTILLLTLPSTVIGIGLMSLWNTSWTNFIYSTPFIIILGYLAKYTALTSRISVAQFAQIPVSMEEAAQVAGAGWFRGMVLITAPLARRCLLTCWLVGYIFSLRDTGITMLVYPPGQETLPVRILTLMANGSPQLIAALCIMMIIATLLPAGILWTMLSMMKRKGIR